MRETQRVSRRVFRQQLVRNTALATAVFAATPWALGDTWKHTGSPTWSLGSNWVDGTAPASTSESVVFPFIFTAYNPNVTVPSGGLCGSLSFAIDMTLSSGTLIIGAAGGPVVNSSPATINTILNGAQGLTKTGTGTLTLGGANVFSGTVNVNGGTLSINSDGRLGSATNPVVINGGTLLISTGFLTSRNFTVSSGLLQCNAGTLELFAPLTAQTGGDVSTANVYVDGSANINGAGSAWTNTGQVSVGTFAFGSPSVTIQNGGSATSAINSIANAVGSTGTALVTGTGSTWTTTSTLSVGTQGNGSVSVQAGADITTQDALVGDLSGSTGTVTVSGAGSTWTTNDDLAIGYNGRGTLTVQDDADISSSGNIHIGSAAGSTGTATVTGTGSTWTTTTFFGVGYTGRGTLNIQSGATVNSDYAWIGANSGSTGTATVTGGGSSWIFTSGPAVGESGNGTLTISAGGSVTSVGADIGRGSTGKGTVTVTDSGSTWNTGASSTRIGWSGNGTLNILAGADVTSPYFTEMALASGSTGTVTVNGVGSTWTIGNELVVGENGKATLNIEAGGVVSNVDGTVASFSGGTGTVTVTGVGSTWTNTDDLDVGDSGNAALNITAGGSVSADLVQVGYFTNSNGVVTLDGSGSTLTCNNLIVGGQNAGRGTLNVLNGADVINPSGHVGVAGVGIATGTATVNGTGSTWLTSNTMNIGYQAIGTLNVEAGGIVASTSVNLGDGASATGTVNVSGTGSLWTITSSGIAMSRNGGTSAININGGTVNVIGGITDFGTGVSSIVLDGGTLNINGYNIGLGGPIDNLSFRSGTLKSVTSINSGAGLTKTTTGVLTLDGNNNFAGPVTVSAGTLIYKTSLLNSTATTVANGAIARITQSIAAPNNVVVRTASITTNTTGVFDLTDNKLIVTTASSIGTWNGGSYTGVTGLIATGRNGGTWNGVGITTSMTDATSGSGYTMLGVATASEVRGIATNGTDFWGNVGVFGFNTLVMYTYGGDANLSGNVDVDDYGQIDFNASTGGVLTGWYNGDFDYSGSQDVDDYGIIDFVINIQGPPFATAATSNFAVASVPEPSSLVWIAAGWFARRRRANR